MGKTRDRAAYMRAWSKTPAGRKYGRRNLAKWRAKNQNRNRQLRQEYKSRNPQKILAATRKRRAMLKGAPGRGFSPDDAKSLLEVFCNLCAYCLSPSPDTMDHVEPLSRGGAHDVDNLVPACSRCNQRKNAKGILCMLSISAI